MKSPTFDELLQVFAWNVGAELLGELVGDAVAKWGARAISGGLRRLGFDELAEKVFKNADGPNVYPACSFSADTLVATEDGQKPISWLMTGDYVLAYNEATGEVGYYPIVGVWSHQDPVVVYLTIDGEIIETTPEHPFYTTNGEWTPAGELSVGDWVIADGKIGQVEAIEFGYEPQWMYNLTVDTAHTFFVGEGRWLVHNACGVLKLGYTNYLEYYRGKIPGVSYLPEESWFELLSREARESTDWRVHFASAAKNARQINFIVDGINLRGLDPGHDWTTHWEMDQVIKNGYEGKLHLWENGKELSPQKAKDWLEQWKSIRGL